MSLPPIHPALVHLPIALIVVSFCADLLMRFRPRRGLRHVGFWTLFAAVLTGIATIAGGYWDLSRAALTDDVRNLVSLHASIGWTLVVSLAVLTMWRWRIRQQARHVVTRPYLLAACLVFVLTAFQSWYGGEMVFSHGAGVAAAGQGTEPQSRAKERLARLRSVLHGEESSMGGIGTHDTSERGTDRR